MDRLLPELAGRRVIRHIDGPLDDTVAAGRAITVRDLLTFRMGYGLLIEPTFDPPFPIVKAADELQLVMGPPDPRTPLTAEQIAGGGPLLSGSGWGFGMAVTVAPDELSPVPGRCGWAGGSGTTWFNDPHRQLIAIAMSQTTGFLFNGGLAEFGTLAAQA